eukprot:6156376-Lingulodinium_polyedra.AAC.1
MHAGSLSPRHYCDWHPVEGTSAELKGSNWHDALPFLDYRAERQPLLHNESRDLTAFGNTLDT